MMESWIVRVDGRAYGPYRFDQMHAFIAEGRVVAQSLVGPEGAPPYPAGADPVLAPLFPAHAGPAPDSSSAPAETTAASKFGRHEDAQEQGLSHVVIVADMKSRAINGLEEEIFNLGSAYPILPQAWLLTTDKSINAVRNMLVQQLGKLDTLFVIDATNDKAAWFNFGPEADSRMRRIWARAGDPDRRSA